ncbi:DUF983 domain-containing protein [Roseomonas rosulenta]|uniref:DUF983 domain-containing protein n=1 Tax=Roseomonas rosulenta TaxID=2748667 RepID=UPI0018DF0FDE|nr:DUF983 domain-containing protein [Roseomonas rosulenta]
MSWDSQRDEPAEPAIHPPAGVALARGAKCLCPACGQGKLFNGYLRVVDECSACHAPLGRIRADDAPPYFTIFLAGHVLLPGVFLVDKIWRPEMWVHMAIWLPAFAIVSTLLLRPVKGMVVAWMMRLGLTGDEQGAPVVVVAPSRRPAPDA